MRIHRFIAAAALGFAIAAGPAQAQDQPSSMRDLIEFRSMNWPGQDLL